MKVTGFNHLSIGTKNLAESVKFYETVLGMQTIPSYNFGFKTKYLRWRRSAIAHLRAGRPGSVLSALRG